MFINYLLIFQIDSRQYPVNVHFSKRTNTNYLNEAFKKVCRIHSSNPSGGILVFVTGRQEVNLLCKKLKEKFPFCYNNQDFIENNKTQSNNNNDVKQSKKNTEMITVDLNS